MIKDKIVSRGKAAKIASALRKKGKKIGFTSGSFDILHSGHAAYLENAKKQCDVLFVAVNSDDSVKKYKGADRPIVPEKERITLVASLASVDYAFLFDERRNRKNILALMPHLYIKGGDRKVEELQSAEIMVKWGGKPLLIPLTKEISSSKIIEKILQAYGEKGPDTKEAASIERKQLKSSPAIFLDRDGTINEEIHFLHEPSKFRLLPHVVEALKMLMNMEYRLVIVSNQTGIGLGYYSKEDFFKVNSEMLKQLSQQGIIIDKIYFCPHTVAERCSCRKPSIALIERAQEELKIDLKRSFMIGDHDVDVIAGKKAGMKSILVLTGHGSKASKAKPDYIAKDLLDAAKWIKEAERG